MAGAPANLSLLLLWPFGCHFLCEPGLRSLQNAHVITLLVKLVTTFSSFRFPELSQLIWNCSSLGSLRKAAYPMNPSAILHEVQQLYNVSDRLGLVGGATSPRHRGTHRHIGKRS